MVYPSEKLLHQQILNNSKHFVLASVGGTKWLFRSVYKMAGTLKKYISAISRFHSNLLHLLRVNPHHGVAVALADSPYAAKPSPLSPDSTLKSILGEGILWAVPKGRRTKQRRLTRKLSLHCGFEDAIPKRNIIACLECGHYHERNTICGNCYDKVREETKAMKEKMGLDLEHNHPRAEVLYVYENEDQLKDKAKQDNKFIVEMEKPRPSWFPSKLLTKAR
ncbi:unnamed protein product [Owenia fusiformis]|uniref:Large ribosomal subunit protein bL32m n=1 Tax=Owenia fusiformis TaxID=6347 RepID=A0A8S4N2K5_OWEFU|nr:unnamed protein product [Owenia fusiformis]